MIKRKNILAYFIYTVCLLSGILAGINSLYAQTTRYVPVQYSSINAAINASFSGDTIDINGTIHESQINVSKSIILRGHGRFNTIIHCSGTNQSVFSITNSVEVTISGMMIRDGQFGINLLNASLNLIDCSVMYNTFGGIKVVSTANLSYYVNLLNSDISYNTGNSTASSSLGIGVYSYLKEGLMTIENCNISNNYANNNRVTAFYGGGIYNRGNLTVNSSTISNNFLNAGTGTDGGGIYNYGNLSINNSTIAYNSVNAGTSSSGGGISNGGNMTIDNCIISHNSVISHGGGAGIANRGELTVNHSTISYNTIYNNTMHGLAQGGGISNGGNLILNNSNISNNSALYYGSGGGIENNSNATINNSSICFNFISAGTFIGGSGIANRIQLGVGAHLYINNSTIAYNRSSGNASYSFGQGLYSYSDSSTIIKNSILALNYLGNSANQDFYGPIQSMGYNLVGSSGSSDFHATGDISGANPLLDTLNDNGGPTLTLALLSGSPAINAGSITNINGDTVIFDQRGYFRGNTIDIGAYEHDGNKIGVLQIPDLICNHQENQPIIKIKISATSHDSISGFSFSTSGTSNIADIQNARLFYTGNNDIFSADTQIGSTVIYTGNSFTINANRNLRKGLNYFWLSYTIDSTADAGNVFDAYCNQIIFNSTTVVPYDTSPLGSRMRVRISPDFTVSDTTQCFQGNHFLFTNQSSSQPLSTNFTWLFGDDSLSHYTDSVYHSYNNPGTYQVTLLDNNCMNTASKTIVVKPSPEAMFTVNKAVQCFTKNRFLLTNSSKIPFSPDTSFYWNFGDMTNDASSNPIHSYAFPDSFNIMLIVSTSLGCTDTQINPVVVHPSSVAAFSINDSAQCIKGNLFTFTNQTTGNQQAPTSYLWKFGNGKTDTSTQLSYSYSKENSYQVSLIAKTDMGCKDTSTKSVIVYPSPIAGFSINDSIQCHAGNLFTFTNEIINPDPGTVNYLWDFGDGFSDTLQNTAHSYVLDDTFNVSLISSNDKGCGDTAKKQIIVNPSPTADFSVSDSIQCFHDNYFTFTNGSSINKGTITFFWDFGNSFTSKVFETSINYINSGNYNVSLKATSGLGCTDSFIMKMIVNPDPVAAFSIVDSIQCFSGNKFELINSSSISTGTFSSNWSFGDNNDTTYFSPVHSYLNPGNFTIKLLVKTNYGCKDSMSKMVEIVPDPIVQSVTGGEHCGPGKLSLFASAINGSINWYSSDVGGVLLFQGDTFYTNAGTTYYVEAINNVCTSTVRKAVTAFVKYVPQISSTNSASRLLPGSVTLRAYASAGIVNWYDSSSGGIILSTGNSYTTPVLSSSKTYYVDATYLGCTTKTRTAVKAIIGPNSITNNHSDKVEVNFYPNPAVDILIFEITGLKEIAILTFIDVQGRVIKSLQLQPVGYKTTIQIDVKDIPQGLYLLNLKNESIFSSGRFVKY